MKKQDDKSKKEVECNDCEWKGYDDELEFYGDEDDVDAEECCPDCGSTNIYWL